MQQRTYETRLPADPGQDAIFGAYTDLYGRAERTLFARLAAGDALVALKRTFLVRFGLIARQFNALAAELRGKMRSIERRRLQRIGNLQRRIQRAKQVLKTTAQQTNTYHQKRRRLESLEHRVAALRADAAAGRTRLCFGSRKVFHQQFALAANGHRSHGAWLRTWRAARSNQFLVLGSKDETGGCQGCIATMEPDGKITLRLRLPNALASHGKYLVIRGIRFAYGHDAVVAAIGRNLSRNTEEHEAISWRFVRDPKGWRVCATVSVRAGNCVTADTMGSLGVDFNADHVAVADLDRFGNVVAAFRVSCVTHGKTHDQALAVIGEAVGQVVTYACLRQKPIVAERLDFEEKKAELERQGASYVRMLSGFAYAAFQAILAARTYDAGVRLYSVNPAYTSVIGPYKFASRYGLSMHQAAACSIGRRGMQLAERPNRRLGDQVAFPLPARNRGKHVWSFWRRVAQRAAAHRARGRPGQVARSSPVARTARRAIRSSAAGGTPARESSAAPFG